MPAHYGFLLAFSAAISHSCIDTLRKAGTRLCGTQLVCLVAILEGSASMAFVLGQVRAEEGQAAVHARACPHTHFPTPLRRAR